MLFPNVTIIMDGYLYLDIDLHHTLTIYTKLCNVILSIYETDLDKINVICGSFPTVKIITNNITKYKSQPLRIDPQFKNHTAISLLMGYCQICCVKLALEIVTTEFVVKTKIDHCYDNIQEFISHGLTTNKITSSSLFHRGVQDRSVENRSKFCLTDTLFMGRTNVIQLCFDLAHENRLLTRVSTGIWTPYFLHIFNELGININDVSDKLYAKYMEDIVDIYCVNKLGPYKLKYFNEVRTYMHDNDKTTYDYLMYGCDC